MTEIGTEKGTHRQRQRQKKEPINIYRDRVRRSGEEEKSTTIETQKDIRKRQKDLRETERQNYIIRDTERQKGQRDNRRVIDRDRD